jgi:ribosomal protein S18 acetylase RimI-like enzyme
MSRSCVIRRFEPGDQAGVEALVLGIQQDEFGLALSADNQPDLKDVAGFFGAPGSAFWVAQAPDTRQLAGCIGLEAVAGGHAAMRKFMVAPAWRGAEHGVAASLHRAFVQHAAAQGCATAILATVPATLAAQRFYARAGYALIAREALPPAFVPGVLDTVFMAAPVERLLRAGA